MSAGALAWPIRDQGQARRGRLVVDRRNRRYIDSRGSDVLSGKIEGTIESIDSSGNLVTGITSAMLAAIVDPATAHVVCEDHETWGIFPDNGDHPPMTFLARLGNQGQLELVIVGDSAAAMLGVSMGARVTVSW